jgi:Cysteine-rich CPXCG
MDVQCPFCREVFSVNLYLEDGESQEMVYDCEICCHPIELAAQWNADTESFVVETQKSSGFD